MSARPPVHRDAEVTVELLDWSEEARTAWQMVRERQAQASPLAEPDWFDVLARTYRPTLSVFAARSANGQPAGVVPTYTVRDIRGGRHLYGLRHGLVADKATTADALCAAVAAHCSSAGIVSALLTSGGASIATAGKRTVRHSLTLALPGDADTLWSSFRDKVRNTIRKAGRSDVQFAVSPERIDDFWRLAADAMTAQSLPVKSRRFFRSIADVFGSRARLYCASRGGSLIGGMLVLANGTEASYAYGAFDPEGRRLGVNSALMWEVSKDLISRGYSALDLGESTVGGGTYKFKQRLGGIATPVHYIDPLHGGAADTESAAGNAAAVRAAPSRFLALANCLPAAAPRRVALTWLGAHSRIL